MIDPSMRAVAYLSRVVEPPCPPLGGTGGPRGTRRSRRPGEATRRSTTPLLRLTEARHEIDSAARRSRSVGATGRSAGHRCGRRMAAAGLHRVRRCRHEAAAGGASSAGAVGDGARAARRGGRARRRRSSELGPATAYGERVRVRYYWGASNDQQRVITPRAQRNWPTEACRQRVG